MSDNLKTERCVIVGGAEIGNYEYIKTLFKDDDFFIYCDCGLRHADSLGTRPDLIVGDFDSYERPDVNGSGESAFSGIETIVLPREKDDTDTVYAAREALRRGFRDFLIIGAIGGRFDHSVGNAALLLLLHEKGAKSVILDDYSRMSIAGSEPVSIDDSCDYFSLLSIFGRSEGVNIDGAKFPLENGIMTPEYQYGVSNEVLPGCTATVSVTKGRLLLVEVFRS